MKDTTVNTSLSFSIGDDLDYESLKMQMLRYKNRVISLEEISNIYRTSVLALYSDGGR